jgi:hypothetical protein
VGGNTGSPLDVLGVVTGGQPAAAPLAAQSVPAPAGSDGGLLGLSSVTGNLLHAGVLGRKA